MVFKLSGNIPKSVNVTTTLTPDEYQALLDWIEKQHPKPSRSEAVRGMILAVLGFSQK